jgi:hypothetical protein
MVVSVKGWSGSNVAPSYGAATLDAIPFRNHATSG